MICSVWARRRRDFVRRAAVIVGGVGAAVGVCFVLANLVPSVLMTRRGPDVDLAPLASVSQSVSLVLCFSGVIGVRLAASGRPRAGALP